MFLTLGRSSLLWCSSVYLGLSLVIHWLCIIAGVSRNPYDLLINVFTIRNLWFKWWNGGSIMWRNLLALSWWRERERVIQNKISIGGILCLMIWGRKAYVLKVVEWWDMIFSVGFKLAKDKKCSGNMNRRNCIDELELMELTRLIMTCWLAIRIYIQKVWSWGLYFWNVFQ